MLRKPEKSTLFIAVTSLLAGAALVLFMPASGNYISKLKVLAMTDPSIIPVISEYADENGNFSNLDAMRILKKYKKNNQKRTREDLVDLIKQRELEQAHLEFEEANRQALNEAGEFSMMIRVYKKIHSNYLEISTEALKESGFESELLQYLQVKSVNANQHARVVLALDAERCIKMQTVFDYMVREKNAKIINLSDCDANGNLSMNVI